MDDRVKIILEFLEPKGLEKKENIRELINDIFPVPDDGNEPHFNAVRSHVNHFLRSINKDDTPHDKTSGYIRFDPVRLNALKSFRDVPDTWFDWFQAAITDDGIKALREDNERLLREKVSQSAIDVNKSIQKANEAMIDNAKIQTGINQQMATNSFTQTTIFGNQTRLYRNTLILTAINIILGGGILYSALKSNADKLVIERLNNQVISQNKEIKQLQLIKSDTIRYVLHYPKFKNSSKK